MSPFHKCVGFRFGVSAILWGKKKIIIKVRCYHNSQAKSNNCVRKELIKLVAMTWLKYKMFTITRKVKEESTKPFFIKKFAMIHHLIPPNLLPVSSQKWSYQLWPSFYSHYWIIRFLVPFFVFRVNPRKPWRMQCKATRIFLRWLVLCLLL